MSPRVFLAIGVALVALGLGLSVALREEEEPMPPPPVSPPAGTRTVELFFPAEGGGFSREAREILGGDFLEDDVRRAIGELIAGPAEGVRPLPPATRLLNVFWDGESEVALSFSDDLRTDHPGGADAELATVRCVVATVGTNFPGVDRVRILVDGEAVPTLAGHADLSRPLDVDDYR